MKSRDTFDDDDHESVQKFLLLLREYSNVAVAVEWILMLMFDTDEDVRC